MISITCGHSGGILIHKTGVNTQRHKCIIYFLTGGVRAHGSGSAERAPGKAQRSLRNRDGRRWNSEAQYRAPGKACFDGTRRSSGMTEISARM